MMQRRESHAETSTEPLQPRQTVENSTEEDDEQNEFAEALLLIIVALMIVQGAIYFEDGKIRLVDNGVSTTELTGFIVAASTQGSLLRLFVKRGALLTIQLSQSKSQCLDHAARNGCAGARGETGAAL